MLNSTNVYPRIRRRTAYASKEDCLQFSVLLNVFLLSFLAILSNHQEGANGHTATGGTRSVLRSEELTFHGGHPAHGMKGSCVCQSDYCMCNPALAIDLVIITSDGEHILLVRRKDTDQLATMGGFVKVGESVEEAIHRELQEEMGLTLTTKPALLGIYSDPRRDNRRHTASAAFAVKLDIENPHAVAADDAKEIVRLSITAVSSTTFFSDHKTIINDYLVSIKNPTGGQTTGDNFENVKRSICNA